MIALNVHLVPSSQPLDPRPVTSVYQEPIRVQLVRSHVLDVCEDITKTMRDL